MNITFRTKEYIRRCLIYLKMELVMAGNVYSEYIPSCSVFDSSNVHRVAFIFPLQNNNTKLIRKRNVEHSKSATPLLSKWWEEKKKKNTYTHIHTHLLNSFRIQCAVRLRTEMSRILLYENFLTELRELRQMKNNDCLKENFLHNVYERNACAMMCRQINTCGG